MNKRFAKLRALVLSLVVGAVAASSTMGQATIVIENFDQPNVGFNDATAAAPVGGNSGTTIGQQRLIAFQHAAGIWGATLPGGPTITIRASWDPNLTCGPSSGTLGSAGSITIHRNFPGAPFTDTWFGGALANTLAGVDLDPANPEIRARFNPDIGTAGECLQNSHWYYGLDTSDPNPFGSINLVTVLLHEFAHGLGFQTFTSSSTGTQNNGFPSIYDRFLFDNTTNKGWTEMTDAERVSSAINTGNLVWNGAQVFADAMLLTSGKDGQGHPRMYAPNPVQGGSSVSHWDTAASPNQLMEPNLSSNLSHSVTVPEDLTFSLLRDIGWCALNCPPPPSPTPTPTPPANNNFASSALISGPSGSVLGTNVSADREAGEPSHSPDGDPGGGSVWYQWTAPDAASVTITTAGSSFDTVLAAYTGGAIGSLTAIAKNDDVDTQGGISTSSITFSATAGTVYKFAVDGWGGDRGSITLNWSQVPTPTFAQMTSPANGSTLSSTTVTFNWSPGTGNSQFYLTVGNGPGTTEHFNNYVSGGTTTVGGLPSDNRTIYVGLWSLRNGQWFNNDYTYQACTGCGSQLAQMTSPATGSTLPSTTVTFNWSPGTGNSQFYLTAGNSLGRAEYFDNYISGGTTTVAGLPGDNRTIYLGLWSLRNAQWLHNEYTYTACGCGSQLAEMTSPANGSTFTSRTVTFNWNPGTGNSQYYLTVGNALGSAENFNNYISGGSTTVAGLPEDNRTIYVGLWSLRNGQWLHNDYTYTACSGCGQLAQMTSPTSGSTFISTSVGFNWSLGSGNSQYFLYVGNSPGSSEYFYNYISGGSTVVGGLPGDGRNIYVRLWSLSPSGWTYLDYHYRSCACFGNQLPQITSPINTSKFNSSSVTFLWTPGTGGSQYFLYAGNSVGSSEYFYNYISGGSTTVAGLPSDGRTIYVRIWSLLPTGWTFHDYVYKAAG